MSDELIFINARVVTRHETFRGTVRVVGGQIDAVDCRPTGSRPALDVEGDYLIPGLLELQDRPAADPPRQVLHPAAR